MVNELPDRKTERSAFLRKHLEDIIFNSCIQYLKDMKVIDAHEGLAVMLSFLSSVTAHTVGLACQDKEIYKKMILNFYKDLQGYEDLIDFDGSTYFDDFE